MEAEIETPHTDISTTTTTASRHYFYRKAKQPDLNNSVSINVSESSQDFESRVTNFILKDTLQKTLARLRQSSAVDLTRRKADRKARKERERTEDSKQQHQQQHRYKEEQQQRTDGPLFQKLNSLNPTEQNQWLSNIHDDAMLMNPHQWLKLASLFNVNSKVSRQQTLIGINSHFDVIKDRNIDDPDSSCNSLENYMELRDVQNRNYAQEAVAEGVKYIKQNRIQDAMDFYKRALDMDPKYADGWFHVAEGLVQQRKLKEAAGQLEKALKFDPDHEGAKALLASIRYTTQTKKTEKGDEWDLVDENGNGLSSSSAKLDKKSDSTIDEDKSSKKKKKSSSSSNYKSHRSSRRSSRSPISRDSRHRSRESRHHRDRDRDSKRRERRSSPDSRRHRRSHRSRSKDSERSSRHDDRKSHHRRDSSPSESRRHSRRHSHDRESRHKNDKRRHRSRSPSKHHSKRKRSDDDKSEKD